MGTTPFHEQGVQQVYGIDEMCIYNDHQLCRNPRCGCSCHKEVRNGSPTSNSVRVNGSIVGAIQTGLDKYCPTCHKKAPSDHFYCKIDGAKLSSLRCPECGTPGEEVDNFCCHCGCPMKAEDREMEAAATGMTVNRLTVDSAEIPAGDIDAEAAMRVAMGERGAKTVPAPTRPKISMGMFK